MSMILLVIVSALHPALPSSAPSSPEDEIELAVSAAPESSRADAGVYVLGDGGYVQRRASANGLNCLVERDRNGSIEPICWDAEGSETLLPVTLEKARLRARGLSEDDVEVAVAKGYAEGRFRAPRRAGVAYMLSMENHVWNGERVIRYYPHVMIYAPFVTNDDIGSDRSSRWLPWVLNEGKPNAYIVTVVRSGEEK